MVGDDRVMLDTHLVLGNSPHCNHAFVLRQHLCVVRPIGEVDDNDKSPHESDGTNNLASQFLLVAAVPERLTK